MGGGSFTDHTKPESKPVDTKGRPRTYADVQEYADFVKEKTTTGTVIKYQGEPYLEIRDVPEKGKGLFAFQKIKKEDLVISYSYR